MKIDIIYSKQSEKFIKKNNNLITYEIVDSLMILAVKKIKRVESSNIDLKDLKPKNSNFYRVRKGDIRIIFSIDENQNIIIVSVGKIGFRGDVYK